MYIRDFPVPTSFASEIEAVSSTSSLEHRCPTNEDRGVIDIAFLA